MEMCVFSGLLPVLFYHQPVHFQVDIRGLLFQQGVYEHKLFKLWSH